MATPLKHQPRKRFGQNFLHDQHVLDRMVAAIAPRQDDRLVEIGPGQGALTFPLLNQVKELMVIELDRDLIEPLRQRAESKGALTIYNADALSFDFTSLTAPGQHLRVVGNLPYNISTPLTFHLLDQADLISDMHFLLQKEVVDRMAAEPGSKTYGRLSVMVQYRCQVESLFQVGPGAFFPPPKVDSAFVRLTPYSKPPVEAQDIQRLNRIVKQAFSQRRKMLRKSLSSLISPESFEISSVDPGARPEELAVADFVRLTNAGLPASTT